MAKQATLSWSIPVWFLIVLAVWIGIKILIGTAELYLKIITI